MQLRKIVFWLHLVAGLVAGVVVLVMSVTGVLLAFERQMIDWADRDMQRTPPTDGTPRLAVSALIDAARAVEPGITPTGLTLCSDPAAPASIALGRDRTLFVNPYTGANLGEGSKRTRDFFHWVTDVHRFLGAHGESRAIGRAVTGACNLAFLFLVVSGLYLWWPRKWTKSAGRAILVPRMNLRGKPRDFNWHNAIGFWSAPVLFILVLTAVTISYSWAGDLVYRLTGTEPPPARAAGQRPGPGPARESVIPKEIDRLWTVAEQRVAGWQTITARFETSPSVPVTFNIAQSHRGRPDLRSQLTLDSTTGEVVRWEPFSSFNLGRQVRSWFRFAHTGEVGGVVGQTIAGLASAGGAILVWTGFALAWRRFRDRKRRRELVSVPEPAKALN